jgi:hypothetical protein
MVGIELEKLNLFIIAQEDPKPPLSHENLVINELIREYLDYNHYKVSGHSYYANSTRQPGNASTSLSV